MLEQAIADGQSSKLPIGRVLAEAEQPIDIHWCPEARSRPACGPSTQAGTAKRRAPRSR
jgi:hypothetical protein